MANTIKHPKKRAFLASYALTGNVSKACQAAEISRFSHYEWLKNDPDYVEAVAKAAEDAADVLEEEARRRAFEGVDEPVFYQGDVCGTVRKYSDTLLIFLLKGAKPQKFRENLRAEVSGPNGGPVQIANLAPDEVAKLYERYRTRHGEGGPTP